MMLPNDIARCHGVRSNPQCHECKRPKQLIFDREKAEKHASYTHMTPPKAAYENKCGFFIGEKE